MGNLSDKIFFDYLKFFEGSFGEGFNKAAVYHESSGVSPDNSFFVNHSFNGADAGELHSHPAVRPSGSGSVESAYFYAVFFTEGEIESHYVQVFFPFFSEKENCIGDGFE